MNWNEVKRTVQRDLRSRPLASPQRRINALDGLERLFGAAYPGFKGDPSQLLEMDKSRLVKRLTQAKGTALSQAEASVLKQVLRVLEGAPDPPSRPAGLIDPGPGVDRAEALERLSPGATADAAAVRKHGLPAVVAEESRILILGTMPGDESLRRQQYYANPRNQFWRILSAVFEVRLGERYEDRIEFLLQRGIALWDVLKSARRLGSLDSAIQEGVPNDFVDLFESHPALRAVGFNGSKAATLFRRHVAPGLAARGIAIQSEILPSSSPTPGRNILSLPEKTSRWKSFLLTYG